MRSIAYISAIIILTADTYTQDRHNQERFLIAHDLISRGQYEAALDSLELNIKNTPDAIDIDYDYGWATVCLAKLCRIDEFFKFYTIMRTQFNGVLHQGGAIRDWDDRLLEAKQTILACPGVDPAATQWLDDLEKRRKIARDSTLERLIKDASMGNSSAVKELTLRGAELAKLISESKLILGRSPDALDAPFPEMSGDIALIRKKGSRAELYLPPRMRSSLASFDSDFTIWGLSDYNALLLGWYPYSETNLPFVVLGDFNGDTKQDVVLHGHNTSADMVICLLSTSNGYHILIVDKWEVQDWTRSSHHDIYLTHVGPGLIESGFEDEPLRLTTDGFQIGYFEKAATLYYYKEGRFRQYTTAD